MKKATILQPYEVEDGQGTGNREHDAGFDTNDGITDSYESTVNSLASLQLSNAAAITATSEDLTSPAGVGQTAPTSLGAGAHLLPAGYVSLGAQNSTAVVSLPTASTTHYLIVLENHHQNLRPLSQTGGFLRAFPCVVV